MRKVFLLILACFIFSCAKEEAEIAFDSLNTEFKGELDFIKNFGGSGNESAQAIIKTTDGGFAILGYTESINGDIATKTEEEVRCSR